jgi:hypothetical protein
MVAIKVNIIIFIYFLVQIANQPEGIVKLERHIFKNSCCEIVECRVVLTLQEHMDCEIASILKVILGCLAVNLFDSGNDLLELVAIAVLYLNPSIHSIASNCLISTLYCKSCREQTQQVCTVRQYENSVALVNEIAIVS